MCAETLLTVVAIALFWLMFWCVVCVAFGLLVEWLEPDELSPTRKVSGPVDEYLKKITKLLDGAQSELDEDEYEELLDLLNDDIIDRQDGGTDEALEDEGD